MKNLISYQLHGDVASVRLDKARRDKYESGNMPVDIKPVTVITSLGKTIKAWTPHWGNCPGGKQFKKKPAPDSRAAYAHHNEDADRIRYAENPEIFGR